MGEMIKHTCKRCRATWWTPVPEPKACQKCRSRLWNQERQRAVGAGRPLGSKSIEEDRTPYMVEEPVQPPKELTLAQEVEAAFRQAMDADPTGDESRVRAHVTQVVKQLRKKREMEQIAADLAEFTPAAIQTPEKPKGLLDIPGVKRGKEFFK